MSNYYTSIIAITLFGLLVLGILVHENGRIPQNDKKYFYLSYILIAAAAVSEWTGVLLDGRADLPSWPLRLAKCLDYILTPMVGGALTLQLKSRSIWKKAMYAALAVNVVVQIVGCFGNLVVKIDEFNHYSEGPCYFFYMVLYIVVLGIVVIEFSLFGTAFSRKNRASLYAILLFVFFGIALQELLDDGIRIVYITLTIGVALLFIHYSEFIQISLVDSLDAKDEQLATDVLTGMRSRYAYSKALSLYENANDLPETFAAFSIDINGLKETNDNYGHAVGDTLIRSAARCITFVFGNPDRCFRTGGDEFIVLTEMSRKEADQAKRDLVQKSREYDIGPFKGVELAAGYALAVDYPGYSAEKLVVEADYEMYKAKDAYYSRVGRRGRRR